MKAKKFLAILMGCTIIASLLAGCGNASGSESTDNTSAELAVAEEAVPAQEDASADESKPSDHLTIGMAADIESFNPWIMANDSRQQVFYDNIYEPLARLTLDGEREYVIAESLEDKGNGTYEIFLNDEVYDSAGNNITADDVIFSYQSCMEQGQLAWGIKYLDHFDKVNDYELTMYLNKESAVALDMVLKTCFIVSQKAYEASSDGFANDPVGTGPYVVTSYEPGSQVVVEARDNYWQTDPEKVSLEATLGSVKTITYKVYTDTSQLALALEMGEIDGSLNIQNVDLDNFLNEDRTPKEGYNVNTNLSALVHFIAFNCSDQSPMSDIRVRQAVSYALDMPSIIENVYGKDAGVATTNSSLYYNDYDPSLNDEIPYAYDVEKAKELLKEAGYEDGELTLKLIYTSEWNREQFVTLIQAYLMAAGINVELQNMEAALFQTSKNDPSAFDLYPDCVQSLNTPGRLGLIDMNGYTTGVNGIFVNDPELQSRFDAANQASTYSKETVTDLLTYLEEQDYLYPTHYMYSYFITNDRVQNIVQDRNLAMIVGASTVVEK